MGSDWRNVGRCLGVEDPTLAQLIQDNESHQEAEYQMLLTWKRSNGSKATYQVLADALKKEGRVDLQEWVLQQDSGTSIE
uniref:death domain-containing protein n=1 Tax=Salmonella sp. s54395 TaxID=3159664 RepID=UPI00397EB854